MNMILTNRLLALNRVPQYYKAFILSCVSSLLGWSSHWSLLGDSCLLMWARKAEAFPGYGYPWLASSLFADWEDTVAVKDGAKVT